MTHSRIIRLVMRLGIALGYGSAFGAVGVYAAAWLSGLERGVSLAGSLAPLDGDGEVMTGNG
jgi:hypothetical protein